MRAPRLSLIIAFLIAAGAPIAAGAQSQTEITALVETGDFDAARQALAVAGGNAADRAFLDALILMRQGRMREAIPILRALLNQSPELIEVRQRLVQALANTGATEAALFHLAELKRRDPNRANLPRYRAFEANLRRSRPWTFSAGVALEPSSNINRGTTNTRFDTAVGSFIIDPASREVTGTGLALFGTVTYAIPAPVPGVLALRAQGSAIFYDDSTFDQASFGLGLSHRRDFGDGALTLALDASRGWYGGARNYDQAGIVALWEQPLSAQSTGSLRFRAREIDYVESAAQSGRFYEFGVGWRRLVTARTRLTATLDLTRGDAEAERFQYDGWRVGAELSHALPSGWRISGSVGYEERPYRGDFPGVPFARDDRLLSFGISALNDRVSFRGATPLLSCQITEARSNIAFYEYTQERCTLGLTRAF